MTDAQVRKILSGDKSFALVSLREIGATIEDYRHVLSSELARRRPRKLLIQSLREKISHLSSPP